MGALTWLADLKSSRSNRTTPPVYPADVSHASVYRYPETSGSDMPRDPYLQRKDYTLGDDLRSAEEDSSATTGSLASGSVVNGSVDSSTTSASIVEGTAAVVLQAELIADACVRISKKR